MTNPPFSCFNISPHWGQPQLEANSTKEGLGSFELLETQIRKKMVLKRGTNREKEILTETQAVGTCSQLLTDVGGR